MHLDDGSMELYIDICGIFKIYTIELYFFHQWFKRVDLKDFHEFYHFLKQHENFVKRIFLFELYAIRVVGFKNKTTKIARKII